MYEDEGMRRSGRGERVKKLSMLQHPPLASSHCTLTVHLLTVVKSQSPRVPRHVSSPAAV